MSNKRGAVHGHWDVLWFHFCGATAEAYYQAFLQQTHGRAAALLPVNSPVSAQMSALLSLAGADGELGRDLEASALLTMILCGLIHGAARQRQLPAPQLLQQVRQYLHEQYAQKLTLDTLSARYNISKYHLQRSFQHYFGQSPGEYLTQLRLTRAKELLRATDLPVSEIAYRVGMENTSYFIYTFRTHEGATPRQYRKSWATFDAAAPAFKKQERGL